MSATDLSILSGPPPRRTSIERWRRRSRLIRSLRVILPVLIGLTLAGLAGSVAYTTLTNGPAKARQADDAIRLVNPRFVGRDDRGRAFVLTAITATRDPQEYQRVILDRPVLLLDDDGPDPTRISALHGVYHEATRKLQVNGNVRLSGARGAFETIESLFDTKTGELEGSNPVHGSGPLGEIDAKSYGVYDKGARMLFKGGVHTVLQPK